MHRSGSSSELEDRKGRSHLTMLPQRTAKDLIGKVSMHKASTAQEEEEEERYWRRLEDLTHPALGMTVATEILLRLLIHLRDQQPALPWVC